MYEVTGGRAEAMRSMCGGKPGQRVYVLGTGDGLVDGAINVLLPPAETIEASPDYPYGDSCEPYDIARERKILDDANPS